MAIDDLIVLTWTAPGDLDMSDGVFGLLGWRTTAQIELAGVYSRTCGNSFPRT